MKKVILGILAIVLVVTPLQVAQAQDQKVLAIIDTAINSSNHPSVIYEACITSTRSVLTMGCPNRQSFMEGTGAASATWPLSINSATYHGDSMVRAALSVDPNIKILFVRYSDVNYSDGASLNRPETLIDAIDWVSKNAERYGVDAVSISQSSIATSNLSLCTTNTKTIEAMSYLVSKNIPVFAATGNNGSLTVIGFPSCVNGVTAVGALANLSFFEKASNRGPGIDAVAIGKASIAKYNGTPMDYYGTSIATVTSAASYVSKSTGSLFFGWFESLSKIAISNVAYPYISR